MPQSINAELLEELFGEIQPGQAVEIFDFCFELAFI